MQKILFLSLTLLLSSTINFSQTTTKIDEFSYDAPCGDMMNRIDIYYQSELKNKPQNKLYVIYYEGAEKRLILTYNPKTKKYKKILENPRLGNALKEQKRFLFT